MVNDFDYVAPHDVDEALDLMRTRAPDVRVLAGGQSLMVLLRQRLVTPGLLVSLKRVQGLDTIEATEDGLRLGAMATYRAVAASTEVAARAPLLARAAGAVGSVHIRNMGTVGGSICHADPAGDVPTTLLALDATLHGARHNETTTYDIAGFFTGLFETRIASDEIVTAVEVPAKSDFSSFGYRRFSFREGEYPMAVVACQLEWEGTVCLSARVAVGGGDLHPKRLAIVEERLVETPVDDAACASVTTDLSDVLRPIPDIRGSAEWKTKVVSRLVERTLKDAVREREIAYG